MFYSGQALRCVRGAVTDPSLALMALADPERLRLLLHLAPSSQRQSVAALSAHLGCPPPDVRRLLRGLHRAGLIEAAEGRAMRAPALNAALHAVWVDLVLACCADQGDHAVAPTLS